MSGVAQPWGFYTVLSEGEGWWVKMLVVLPGQRLSRQYHRHRAEHWTVVAGRGRAEVGALRSSHGRGTFLLAPGSSVLVSHREEHRLINDSTDRLVVVEVATGSCSEDDVVRLEDDYGRVGA